LAAPGDGLRGLGYQSREACAGELWQNGLGRLAKRRGGVRDTTRPQCGLLRSSDFQGAGNPGKAGRPLDFRVDIALQRICTGGGFVIGRGRVHPGRQGVIIRRGRTESFQCDPSRHQASSF
jgi:hypothetical protein